MSTNPTPEKILLAADVGNTTVGVALFRGVRRLRRWRIPVEDLGKPKAMFRILSARPAPEALVICSVNPPASRKLAQWAERRLGLRPLLVGQDLPIPMPLKTAPGVGADRLCNALAAYERVRGACVVVSCGTAVTVDAVSAQGEFLGGAIACGLRAAARALHERTALLPLIAPRAPARPIGHDTQEAVRIGLVLGTAGAIERLVEGARDALGGTVSVMATGGDAELLGKFVRCFDMIVPGLALEGVCALYQRHLGPGPGKGEAPKTRESG